MSRAERVRILFSGRVQGVGFRWRTASTAESFDVTGTVRNLTDGSVELIAEGERAEIERFLAALRTQFRGYIRSEDAEWSAATGAFRTFAIERSGSR